MGFTMVGVVVLFDWVEFVTARLFRRALGGAGGAGGLIISPPSAVFLGTYPSTPFGSYPKTFNNNNYNDNNDPPSL